MHCMNYVGVICINGCCPNALADEFPDCGNNDEWYFPAFATRKITIPKNTRICQFRIIEHQHPIYLVEVSKLSEINRGGFGSTGDK